MHQKGGTWKRGKCSSYWLRVYVATVGTKWLSKVALCVCSQICQTSTCICGLKSFSLNEVPISIKIQALQKCKTRRLLGWIRACLLLQHIHQQSLKGHCRAVTGELAAGKLKELAGQPQHTAVHVFITTPTAAFTLTETAGSEGRWQEAQEAETCLWYTSTGHCEWEAGQTRVSLAGPCSLQISQVHFHKLLQVYLH